MSLRKFKHDLIRGLGSCYIELENCNEIAKYKDIVVFGLTNSISFDQQVEGTRSHYLYGLAELYNDNEYFVLRITDRLNKRIYNTDLFIHLIEHLVPFAQNGSLNAKNELYRVYNVYLKKFNRNEEYYIKLDRLCSCLLQVDGIKFIKYHLGKINKLRKKPSEEDLGWFHNNAVSRYKEEVYSLFQTVYPSFPTSPIYLKTPEVVTHNLLLEMLEDEDWNNKLYFYSLKASKEEVEKTIDYMIDCEDINTLRKLLQVLGNRGGSLYKLESVLELRNKYGEEVNDLLYDYVREVRCDMIKKLGYTLLKDKSKRAVGLQMIANNYTKDDYGTLLINVKKVKVDYQESEDWFDLYYCIIELLDNNRKNLPEELLLHMYNESLSSFIREQVFAVMHKRRLLTPKLIEEALCDSDYDMNKKAYIYKKKYIQR